MEKSMSTYVVSASSTGGKFWEVEVLGGDMRIRYGKLGADPKWSTKTFDSPEKALKEAEKKLRSKTTKGYVEAPRPSEVTDTDVVLAESHLAAVFYFRAFDRAPGGNADMTTIKLTFRAGPGEAGTLVAKQHSNWDGEHFTYSEAPVALDLSTTSPVMVAAAQALLDGGIAQSTFTIIDPRSDSDEYDTEWSSLEFSLYTVPDLKTAPEDGQLVVHAVQKALSYTKQKGNPPDEVSQAFIDAVQELVGIGRVDQLNDSSAFRDACKPVSTSHGYQDRDVPLFL